MNQELLDRLRVADPDLWARVTVPVSEIDHCTRCDAWLQHCIQDAIRARGWAWAIGRSSSGMISASVYAPGGDGHTIMGYPVAEALLRAYLAAIEEAKRE